MTKKGNAKNGAIAIRATIIAKAMALTRRSWLVISAAATEASRSMSGRPPKQAGRPDQKDDRHDDEHHGFRRLRVELLGQALYDAKNEAGQDRTEDRSHAANHHDCEDDSNDVRAHARTDLIDRRGKHAGKGRKRDAKAISERDHA